MQKNIQLQLLECGYCDGKEHQVLKGGRRQIIKFPAMVGFLEHPQHGPILFDTGYTDRFYEETRRWPNKLFAKMTPTHVNKEEFAVEQLRARGYAPEDVRYIIISHFHADHVCGMKDFPNTTFICSQAAFENIQKTKGWRAVFQGVLPNLVPQDLADRVWIYDQDETIVKQEHEYFEYSHDLFGDGLVQLIPLPGHHTGQIGAIVESQKGQIMLCADACWLSASYKENRLPAAISKLLLSSWKDFKDSLERLHRFHKAHPEVLIIPTHCEQAQQEFDDLLLK